MAALTRRGAWGIVLLATGMLTVLATAVAWFLLPVQYEAYALLKVAQTPPAVLADGNPRADEFSMFKRTQAQLLSSYSVLSGTLRNPAIHRLSIVEQHKDDQVAWLKDHLSVEYPNNTEVMRVSLRGTNPNEAVRVVDEVVKVYLREIVYREKQLRMENEDQLRRAYEKQSSDYQTQLAALSNLQKIHKTSGSEAAQLKKTLAMDDLNAMMARRARLVDEIRQTELEIKLAKAREELGKEVRTGTAAVNVASSEPLTLPLLVRKREILQDQLAVAQKDIAFQTNIVMSLETFSEQVAAKQDEIEALRTIKNRLGAELDRASVERLAPDRVTVIDEAILANKNGDALWRGVGLSAVAACGLALIVVGIALQTRGGGPV